MVTLLPSTATRGITIIPLDVGTTLTISNPASAKKGANFPASGILIRNDTGGPVPFVAIPLSYNGVSLGIATTGVDGDYLKTVSIGVEGTFTLKANFAGGSGFAASEAQSRVSVGVGVPLIGIPYIALAPIVTGLVIAHVFKR